MRPVHQGAFDALCGVYAVINALTPAGVAGPRSTLHRDLFRKMTTAIPDKALKDVLHHGLQTDQLITIARVGFRWLRSTHDIDLRISRACNEDPTRFEFLNRVATLAGKPDCAVIVCVMRPGLSHWSVVQNFKATTMKLRDSGPMWEADLDRYDVDQGRYRFSSADTLVIKRLSNRPNRSRRSTLDSRPPTPPRCEETR